MKALVSVVGIVLLMSCGFPAFAAGHYEFKGLHVGMNGDQAKKLGLTCQKSSDSKVTWLYDEKCIPVSGNDRFSTFGGEKVTLMEVAIKNGAILMIYVKTMGKYGGGLERDMAAKYGKPKKSNGSWQRGTFLWDRGGAEFISLAMNNGVNEVTFSYDDSEQNARQKGKKAASDF